MTIGPIKLNLEMMIMQDLYLKGIQKEPEKICMIKVIYTWNSNKKHIEKL